MTAAWCDQDLWLLLASCRFILRGDTVIEKQDYENERKKLGASFGKVARDYAKSRPTYSDIAILDELFDAKDVLELGAGTGLFSRLIHNRDTTSYFASDLSSEMLLANDEVLSSNKVAAVAEALPFSDASFDTVAAAQAAHWFDLASAPREIRRIMRDSGTLVIIWNHRDSSHHWVQDFDRVVDSYQNRIVTDQILKEFEASSLFAKFYHHSLPLLHSIDEAQAKQLINSFSPVSILPELQRTEVIERALEILRKAHPGNSQFEIPYTTNYFLAQAK